MYMLDWQIFHSWYSQVDKSLNTKFLYDFSWTKFRTNHVVRFFVHKIVVYYLFLQIFMHKIIGYYLLHLMALCTFSRNFKISKIWKRAPGF
jgi:hypothetical protein